MPRQLPALLLLALASCQTAPTASQKPAARPAPAPAPAQGAGYVDEAALDRAADPCEDFYQFACGTWIKKTPIPPDRAQWSRSFSEIDARNEKILREILEGAAAGKQGAADPYEDKIGAFYAACMDEDRAETASLAALKEDLARIDALRDTKGLPAVLAALHRQGAFALFHIEAQQDFKDASQMIGGVDQGGMGLPDRDYYLKDDAKLAETRARYVEHVGRMLALLGEPQKKAEAQAKAVMGIETALARVSMSRTERRDPYKIYHPMDRAGLEKKAPRFGWTAYFTALGHKDVQALNVVAPDFFAGLSDLLGKARVEDLRAYLRWQLLSDAAPTLGKKFVDEDFRFKGQTLSGAKELLPRWKRCVAATDGALGEAVARPFVRRAFGGESKERSLAMIRGIEAAFAQNLQALPWMDDATRAAAAEKMGRIVNKIGYPDRWRDYGALEVDRASFYRNAARAAAFDLDRDLRKIGQPLDRGEWLMSPPTVNAYYNPSMNEMVFPAGILQPPFYSRDLSAAVNFGAIGMVMGHELTHGFDDEGRQFDGAGNLRDWWSKDVGKAFTDRADCVAKQYEGYEVLDGRRINGRLTLGENIADIGGLKFAYQAYRAAQPAEGTAPAEKVAGFSSDQQFFLAFAQGWCTSRRDELALRRLIDDPHSPPRFRVNGPLADTPEFQAAFQCKAGSKMAPANRCAVW